MRMVSVLVLLAVVAGSCGGGRRPPETPAPAPSSSNGVHSGGAVQQLYESGRYRELLQQVGAGEADGAALWFAAQSQLRRRSIAQPTPIRGLPMRTTTPPLPTIGSIDPISW